MTLATEVRIVAPLSPKTVFMYCRDLIGATDSTEWEHREWEVMPYSVPVHSYRNLPGGGVPAWLKVSYCPDGPLPCDEGDEPEGCLAVILNTSYSFRGAIGGCGSLHRHLVGQLGGWLDEQGADWWAHDEFTGEWHHRTPCPVPS